MAITVTHSWRLGTTHPVAGYTPTTFLDDGLSGTGVSDTQSLTFGPGEGYHDISAQLSAAKAFSCPVAVSALAFTWGTSFNPGLPPFSPIPDPADPDLGSQSTITGFHSLDGATWTAFTFDSGAAASSGGAIGATGTAVRAFSPAVTIRYLHFIVTSRLKVFDANTTISATAEALEITTTHVQAPPIAPVLSAQGACEGAQNTLTWTNPGCTDTYDIERGGVVIQTGIAALTFTDAPVTVGQAYSYRVRGVNAGGAGPWSASVVYTPCVLPTTPTTSTQVRVKATCEGRQVTLWFAGAVANATHYVVRLYGPGIPTTGVVVYDDVYLPSEAGGFVLKPLDYRGYELTVTARNATGSGPEGQRLAFTPCETGCDCAVWKEENCR